jgi:RNA polymerase sigma-70 factor (ECF subfamily)
VIREDAPPRSPAAACARLYRDHAAPVARWLSSLGVPHADVPDLVQEVFLVAHRRLGTFRGDARLETWLYAIALNVARQQRRQVSTRTRLSTAVQAAQPPSPHPLTPERALELMRTAGLIEHIVSRLSPSYRRVFVFQAIEGRSGVSG